MFQKASRLKLRFKSSKGLLSVEDLWDLPLTSNTGANNLDTIICDLHRQLKDDDNISFVINSRKSDATVQLKFDIVKHIIDVRLAEDKVRLEAKDKAMKKQKILELIADKQEENLKGKSLDELMAMVNELD